jgi:1-aminocyclopropane-1-carboxylate deaminase/D-cysteine desulfhydrase-like pyridoxal-dependent ACC family enzyme
MLTAQTSTTVLRDQELGRAGPELVVGKPVYTGKMMYGITDLIQKGFFKKGSKILAIHTGGLQGWNDSIKLK